MTEEPQIYYKKGSHGNDEYALIVPFLHRCDFFIKDENINYISLGLKEYKKIERLLKNKNQEEKYDILKKEFKKLSKKKISI